MATKEWARVNLCELHAEVVEQEQVEYYEANKAGVKLVHDDRRLFYQIVQHMPLAWRKWYIYPQRLEARA